MRGGEEVECEAVARIDRGTVRNWGGLRVAGLCVEAPDDCQYTKSSIRQRSHAGRGVAGLCVEAPMTASARKNSVMQRSHAGRRGGRGWRR